MTLRVLEFNDTGLRMSDESGIVISSPGYALVMPKQIAFGEAARAQSRINPLNSYNQFWHKLSLDPFARPVAHYRHNADLAYSHLQDLAVASQYEGDVVLAVPGSFTREQLAILLGLMKQSPFRVAGIIDASLAAAIDHADAEGVLHADLHLHHMVLSRLHRSGNELRRDEVVVLPGTGWVNLSESLLQLVTSAFIAQCRFNPQHNADSEQQLLDLLPHWLEEEQADLSAGGESERTHLQIRLSHNTTVHEASLARGSLTARLQSAYQKIAQQLQQLDPSGNFPVLVSDRLQRLPGLMAALTAKGMQREVLPLAADAVSSACLRYQDVLTGQQGGVHFVSRMHRKSPHSHPAPAPDTLLTPAPTHLLLEHQARPLSSGLQICLTRRQASPSLMLVRKDVQEAISDAQVLGTIEKEHHHYHISGGALLARNGRTLGEKERLALGDVLTVQGVDTPITLIRMLEHDD